MFVRLIRVNTFCEIKMKDKHNKNTTNAITSFFSQYQALYSLKGIRRGIERETIRSTAQKRISPLAHPMALGAALTHPSITTDFGEAQIELVTPAMSDRHDTFHFLATLHHFVASHLPDDEILWGASMPPILPNDDQIKIADYGTSNAGQLKALYRQGLANRYGKRMQLISGIHYNFSLPESFWTALHLYTQSDLPLDEFISERYFDLIRNVLRHGWIIAYLFGASPAVDKSYLVNKAHDLQRLDEETYYLPWATSLRLSNLGYSSNEQSLYSVSFNSKQGYLDDLYKILNQPSERYIHLRDNQQINSSVLQLENELYGTVRPKIVSDNLRPLYALCHHGVQYIELRSVDNNPYLPFGISEAQTQFLDIFMTYCALTPSIKMTTQERSIIDKRQQLVAIEGRKPGAMLPTLTGEQSLQDLAEDMFSALLTVAKQFDIAFDTHAYQDVLQQELHKVHQPSLTPSAQMLAQMIAENMSYNTLVHSLSQQHLPTYKKADIAADEIMTLQVLAQESHNKQQQMELQQGMNFDVYLQQKNTLQPDCEQ